MSRHHEYAVRLFLGFLNERYRRAFSPANLNDPRFDAEDPDAGRIVIYAADLFDPGMRSDLKREDYSDDGAFAVAQQNATAAWEQRRAELEARLDDARPGSYLLWVPPGGDLPAEEPGESEWVRRVVLAASKLASGRAGEVRLPVRMALGKIRDEGGYASVTGGLGRHWTSIAEKLHGSFYLDSRGLNRFTVNEEERESLYEHIALLSQGLDLGDLTEFEHEDAWSIQRLPRGDAGKDLEDGWAITGAPTGFDPNDGGAIRRLLRRRLADATEVLKGEKGAVRALVLVGAYDYIAGENAGPSLRGFDPALTALFDVIALVSDADVKPLRISRGLPFSEIAAP